MKIFAKNRLKKKITKFSGKYILVVTDLTQGKRSEARILLAVRA